LQLAKALFHVELSAASVETVSSILFKVAVNLLEGIHETHLPCVAYPKDPYFCRDNLLAEILFWELVLERQTLVMTSVLDHRSAADTGDNGKN
jgi:hypothetical protein